jgi:hypothetical protein
MSFCCTRFGVELSSTPNLVQPTDITHTQCTKCHCATPPENEQLTIETYRGPYFLINWIKCISRWFHYAGTLWCTVNRTLSLATLTFIQETPGTQLGWHACWCLWSPCSFPHYSGWHCTLKLGCSLYVPHQCQFIITVIQSFNNLQYRLIYWQSH